MYLILMNPNDEKNGIYKGAICILDGKLWYVTGLAKPSVFRDKDKVREMVKKPKKSNPEKNFQIVDVEFYLSLIDADLSNPWVNQLRQEQLEL